VQVPQSDASSDDDDEFMGEGNMRQDGVPPPDATATTRPPPTPTRTLRVRAAAGDGARQARRRLDDGRFEQNPPELSQRELRADTGLSLTENWGRTNATGPGVQVLERLEQPDGGVGFFADRLGATSGPPKRAKTLNFHTATPAEKAGILQARKSECGRSGRTSRQPDLSRDRSCEIYLKKATSQFPCSGLTRTATSIGGSQVARPSRPTISPACVERRPRGRGRHSYGFSDVRLGGAEDSVVVGGL
jgi:hypothetical protein